MDPKAGDVVRQRLQVFLEYMESESEPSDEGRQRFNHFAQAVNDLATHYEALASVNRATPEQPAQGYDGWLVAFFDEINQDMWNRQPGDRLTFRQKFDMSGQIFTALLGLTLFVSVVIYMAMNIDEWEFGRKR